MLKITESPALIHAGLYHLELDGRQVGTVYAFTGCYDRIREALEEREATPEEGYLLEEQGREIATLARRVERAEAVKESLTSALRDIKKNVDDWNLQDYVTIRRLVNAVLRTTEETNNDTHDRPVETLLLIKELGRMSKKLDALKGSLRNIADNAAHWDTGRGPDASAFGWIHDIAEAALRTAEESSVVDGPPAKQPEGMTKLDKALQNIAVVKRILIENSCPSEFGLKDCECDDSCCEDCWNEEVTE